MAIAKLLGRASKLTMTIEQGATFNPVFTYYDNSVDPAVIIDITGFTARLQIRESIDALVPLVELTTENAGIVLGDAAGTIQLIILPAATAAFDPDDFKRAVYDLELISPSAIVTRIMQGSIILSKEVTR
jgi:hypothetical protein